MRADAAGDTADPSAAAHEHAREMFRRPSHGRPRWNTSTNSKKPGGSARGVRVSEEEEAKANKWKTPFERALERVRTPRSKASPPSSSESSVQRRRCSWSKTLSDSDESSNEDSAHGTRGSERGHIISAVAAMGFESHECKLRSKVVSTKIVNILAPDSINSISSITYAASNKRAGGASGWAAPEKVNTVDRAGMSCVRVKANSPKIGLEQQKMEIKGGAEFASVLKLNKVLEQEARQKERIATATAAKLEELARALFQKEAHRSQLEQENRRLQLAAQQVAFDLARAHDQIAALNTQAREVTINGSGATRVEISDALSDANDLLQSLQEAKSSTTASGPFGSGRSHVTKRSDSDRPALIGSGHGSLSKGFESGASREESVMSTEGGFNQSELAFIRRERAKALIEILANVPERENTLARSRSGSRSDLVSKSRCCVCVSTRIGKSEALRASACAPSAYASGRMLYTSSRCGHEASPWVLSVHVLQARQLPPQRRGSQTAWISCALAVTTGCQSASHLFNKSARRSVERTHKCPRTSKPTWNHHFNFTSASSCDADCQCEARQGFSAPVLTHNLDGAGVTLVVGLYDHTQDGDEDPIGSVILPARPGADAVDWYILKSPAGIPVLDSAGELSYLKIRVTYARTREIDVDANWPKEWATCVPVHSSSSVITLVEPGEGACGISMLLDEPRRFVKVPSTLSTMPEDPTAFVDDLCFILNVRPRRIEFCGVVRESTTILTFNIKPANADFTGNIFMAQPSPRQLALSLYTMVRDPLSALRQARSTRACFRILVHAPIVDSGEEKSEALDPITVSGLFLPTEKDTQVDSDLLPLTVTAVFVAPSHVIEKKPTAGLGIALKDCESPEGIARVLVRGILHGGTADQDGTIQVGDVLIAIDGDDIAGLDQAHVRSKIIGDTGTFVRLKLERMQGSTEALQYEVNLPRGTSLDQAFANGAEPSQSAHGVVGDSFCRGAQGQARPSRSLDHGSQPRVLATSPPLSLRNPACPAAMSSVKESAEGCNSILPYVPRFGTRSALSIPCLPLVDGQPGEVVHGLKSPLSRTEHPSPILKAEPTPLKSALPDHDLAIDGHLAMAPERSTSSLSLANGNLTDRSHLSSSPRTPRGTASVPSHCGPWSVSAGFPPVAHASFSPSPASSGADIRHAFAHHWQGFPRCDVSSRSSTCSTPTHGRRVEEALL